MRKLFNNRAKSFFDRCIDSLGVLLSICGALTQAREGGGGGVAAALFSSRHPQNFENEQNFLCLKIAEIDMGGGGSILGPGERFWTQKLIFKNVKPVLRGQIAECDDSFP